MSVSETTEKHLDASNRQLWLKGLAAIEQNNEAYAASLILPVVQANPHFLKGRKTLRKCQGAATAEQGSGGSKVFGLSIGGKSKSASREAKSLAKKDPTAALATIEAELGEDPNSPDLNDLLHDCAAKLGMITTAEFALETVHSSAPENTKLLHKLATYYIGTLKFAEAAKVYKTISQHHPTDSEAIKGEKDCMAKASMQASTTTATDGSLNLKVRDDSLRIELEQKSRTGLTKEQLHERRDALIAIYTADQQNLANVKELAETYEKLDDFTNAHTFFAWAYQLSENDKTIQGKAFEMKQKSDKLQVTAIEQALEADPDNIELQTQLAEFKKSSLEERIADCEGRVDQNPTDGLLRYDLGKAYFEAGRHGEAIPHYRINCP